MRRDLACLSFALLLWAWPAAESSACSCIGTSACAAVERADAVFVGRAVSGTSPVQFEVERALKGVSVGPLAIGNGQGNCALTFSSGERYLVYAYRDAAGQLETSLCTRTRSLRDPRTGVDLAVLDARSGGRPPAGFLVGSVIDATPRLGERRLESGGVGGVRITVMPSDGHRPIVTSSRPDGSYRIAGLPPGRFTVTAELPAPFEPATPVAADMTTASCAEVQLEAFVDGRLRGQLLDAQGRAARGIEVQAVNPEAMRTETSFVRVFRALTDEEGAFEFRRVAAGRYLIGVELQRAVRPGVLDRRRFFGETRDSAAATIVDLGPAEHRDLGAFRLVALPSERTISVVIHAPSADVAAATQLYVTGATRTLVSERSADAATLRLRFGAAFRLEAIAPAGHRVEPQWSVSIGRDDVARTIEFTVQP